MDQILEILGPGGEDDKIDFEQFYQKFVQFMNQGDNIDEEEEDTMQQVVEEKAVITKPSNHKMDGGVFNENLKRSFEKNIIPNKTSPNKQRNFRRKPSQVSFPCSYCFFWNAQQILSCCTIDNLFIIFCLGSTIWPHPPGEHIFRG